SSQHCFLSSLSPHSRRLCPQARPMRARALADTIAADNRRRTPMRPFLKWGALVAIVSIAPLASVAAIHLHKPPNKLNEAITAIGFHPITPPVLLRAPGSIYHVSSNGQDYDMLCEVSPDRLIGVTRTSSSATQVTSELRKTQYS